MIQSSLAEILKKARSAFGEDYPICLMLERGLFDEAVFQLRRVIDTAECKLLRDELFYAVRLYGRGRHPDPDAVQRDLDNKARVAENLITELHAALFQRHQAQGHVKSGLRPTPR